VTGTNNWFTSGLSKHADLCGATDYDAHRCCSIRQTNFSFQTKQIWTLRQWCTLPVDVVRCSGISFTLAQVINAGKHFAAGSSHIYTAAAFH
jgi:hypothetical protein